MAGLCGAPGSWRGEGPASDEARMRVELRRIQKIVRGLMSARARDNAGSVLVALDRYGAKVGLDRPHRLAQCES